MWSLAAAIKYDNKGGDRNRQSVVASVHETAHTFFRGHNRGLKSLRYAKDNDLILTAGFDFEAYCFDPDSTSIHMKLKGHSSSVIHVTVVYTPIERAVTADNNSVIKLWSLDRGQGALAECLQSFTFDSGAIDNSGISDMVATNQHTSIAILQQKLFSLFMDATPEVKAIPGGIIISERLNRMWKFGGKAVTVSELATGAVVKILAVVDIDNIDVDRGHDTSSARTAEKGKHRMPPRRRPDGTKVPDRQSIMAASNIDRDETKHGDPTLSTASVRKTATSSSHGKVQGISLNDQATAVTSDLACKKLFIGTSNGCVLLVESASLGALADIAIDSTLSSDARASRGAVVSLHYSDATELLTAIFASGTILVLSGAMYSIEGTIADPQYNPKIRDENGNPNDAPPGYKGGQPPRSPRILRSLKESYESTKVVSAAQSLDVNCIAVATGDGAVRLFDYWTLTFLSALSTPAIDTEGKEVKDKASSGMSLVTVPVTSITFAPLAPLLITGDAQGRLTVFTVRPLTPAWIFTWYAIPLPTF